MTWRRVLRRIVPRLDRPSFYRAPRERRQCPACESPALSALDVYKLPAPIDGRRTAFVSGCESCGLVFVNPPPTQADLDAFYTVEGEWGAERVDDTPASAVAPVRPGAGSWPRMFDAVRDELDVTRPPRGARALDFGCGNGKFLDVLQACGWETSGIEPATTAAFPRHAQLTAVPASPEFDLIVVHHVLEHLFDPLTILRQLAQAAKPGALLLLAGPRLDTLPLHRDYRYVISRVHVTAYTVACVTQLLARSGWAVVAPPSDQIRIAGGRTTSARLRLLARRDLHVPPGPPRPLDAARAALYGYFDVLGERSLRSVGAVRCSAALIELRRRVRRRVRRPA